MWIVLNQCTNDCFELWIVGFPCSGSAGTRSKDRSDHQKEKRVVELVVLWALKSDFTKFFLSHSFWSSIVDSRSKAEALLFVKRRVPWFCHQIFFLFVALIKFPVDFFFFLRKWFCYKRKKKCSNTINLEHCLSVFVEKSLNWELEAQMLIPALSLRRWENQVILSVNGIGIWISH